MEERLEDRYIAYLLIRPTLLPLELYCSVSKLKGLEYAIMHANMNGPVCIDYLYCGAAQIHWPLICSHYGRGRMGQYASSFLPSAVQFTLAPSSIANVKMLGLRTGRSIYAGRVALTSEQHTLHFEGGRLSDGSCILPRGIAMCSESGIMHSSLFIHLSKRLKDYCI